MELYSSKIEMLDDSSDDETYVLPKKIPKVIMPSYNKIAKSYSDTDDAMTDTDSDDIPGMYGVGAPPILDSDDDILTSDDDTTSDESELLTSDDTVATSKLKKLFKPLVAKKMKDLTKGDTFTETKMPDKPKTDIPVLSKDGIEYREYQKLGRPVQLLIQKNQCQYCGRFYNKEMITDFVGDHVCFHCVFTINYDISARSSVDGIGGMMIANYIINCKDDHDKAECQRQCFICDHVNGIHIAGISNSELVNGPPVTVGFGSDDEGEEFRVQITI